MLFPKNFLRDLVNDDNQIGKVIEKEVLYKSEEFTYYKMTFKFDNKFYETQYSMGIDGYQNESIYEYTVECDEVF